MLLDEADVDYGNRWRTGSELEQRARLLTAWRQMADAGPQAGSYARLVVALAITPSESDSDPVEELKNELGPHVQEVILRELTGGEMRELGERVCHLYRTAYDLKDNDAASMNGHVSDALNAQANGAEQRNPRKFIRLLLEKLDAAYA